MSSSPRFLALDGLSQIIGEGRILSDVTNDERWTGSPPSERATAQRLITETLRYLGRADHILQPFLQRQPPLRVTNLLRMATVELMTGGAAHGVVHEAVALAGRNRKTAPMKGLVNAVLRKVSAVDSSAWESAPETRLPKWMRAKLVAAWGKVAVARMEKAHAVVPPVDISVKSDTSDWAERMNARVLPTGSLRLETAGQVSALPGFSDGAWWVQDAAAALPARLLGDIDGLRVLDICAAPGGKTMQLAALGADVTALDISKTRMSRLQENLARTGLKATTVIEDARKYGDGAFDAVVLDAPCSATGTIRRHPDLPYVKGLAGVADLISLQRELLQSSLRHLTPDGRLVYCTCSLFPEEGEEQIKWLLSGNDDLTVLTPECAGLDPDWITDEGGVRLRPDYWPDIGGMDGFYMAVIAYKGTRLSS